MHYLFLIELILRFKIHFPSDETMFQHKTRTRLTKMPVFYDAAGPPPSKIRRKAKAKSPQRQRVPPAMRQYEVSANNTSVVNIIYNCMIFRYHR